MRFVDQVRILVRAGDGGDGVVAWRREKFVPMGGPAGGDGGDGGDVILEASRHLSTLLDLRYRQRYRAESGRPGGTKRMNGRAGDDLRIRVPVGTMVFYEGVAGDPGAPPPWVASAAGPEEPGLENILIVDGEGPDGAVASLFDALPTDVDEATITARAAALKAERHVSRSGDGPGPALDRGTLIGDLVDDGQELRIARGGRGGRGNVHFVSSTNRAPDHAERGLTGEAMWLRLELKLLADVGIVGYPNVGKSTLISRISRARPKIADYPFTTLVPQLGVVSLPGDRSMVVADIPGLIDGASSGRGLGHSFLRHLERTSVLLHLLAPDPTEGRSPLADLEALERELSRYGDMFAGRPRVVALGKIDTPEGQALLQPTREALKARGVPVFPISGVTGEGIPKLLEALYKRVALTRT